MNIAIVSDTHLPTTLRRLPEPLIEQLTGVDHILHAGDLVAIEVLDRLSQIAPTTAVAGNMDPPEVAAHLNAREILSLGGRTIGLQHGHQRQELQSLYIGRPYEAPEFEMFFEAMIAQLPSAEVIVFGHFHEPTVRAYRGVLFVNPGSIAPPHARPTFARMQLDDVIEARIVPL